MKERDITGDEEGTSYGDGLVAAVDWKVGPDELLAEFDQQLAEHNLEIEILDAGSDEYIWHILPRQEKAKMRYAVTLTYRPEPDAAPITEEVARFTHFSHANKFARSMQSPGCVARSFDTERKAT